MPLEFRSDGTVIVPVWQASKDPETDAWFEEFRHGMDAPAREAAMARLGQVAEEVSRESASPFRP